MNCHLLHRCRVSRVINFLIFIYFFSFCTFFFLFLVIQLLHISYSTLQQYFQFNSYILGKYGIEAAAKTALDFEIFASTHVDSFDDVHAEKSFENVLQPLNDAEFNVAYAWNVVQQKYNIIERRDQSHDLQVKMNSVKCF